MRYRKGKSFHLDAAKRECIKPEKLDMLLHGDVLKNPPLTQPKEKDVPDLNTALRTALENGKREFLQKTLDAWDKDEQEQIKGEPTMPTFSQPTIPLPNGNGRRVFGITNNVTRVTFNYIRDNPGCVASDAVAALVPKGYKASSVTPIISQLIKSGTVSRDLDTRQLRALTSEYRPITAASQRIRLSGTRTAHAATKPKSPPTKRQQPHEAGIAALAPKTKAKEVVVPAHEEQTEVQRTTTTLLISKGWTAQGAVDKLSVTQARQLYDLLKQIFGG